MEEFVDILECRRKESSTVTYFLKEHYSKHTYIQNGPTDALTHKISVLQSRRIQELIDKVT